jgi:hypothetical protein
MSGRRIRKSVAFVRRQCRKIARAYHLACAREDARTWQLVIPAGVWICQHCPQVTFFDRSRLREHYLLAHAWA